MPPRECCSEKRLKRWPATSCVIAPRPWVSGDSAVQALEEDDFDVVVLDLKMPGMDGITTLKEIKKLGLFTETLILTGHGAIDTALEAMKLGAYVYLTKPCEIDELVNKIEGAWGKKDGEVKKRHPE